MTEPPPYRTPPSRPPSTEGEDARELDQFERDVSSPRRVVGWSLALVSTLGFAASAFLRVHAGLKHEQWAWMDEWVFLSGVIFVFGLLGGTRGRPGPSLYDGVSSQSKLRLPAQILVGALVVLCAATADCGLARIGAHRIDKQSYAPLVEMRIDADWGLVLFGVMLVAVINWR